MVENNEQRKVLKHSFKLDDLSDKNKVRVKLLTDKGRYLDKTQSITLYDLSSGMLVLDKTSHVTLIARGSEQIEQLEEIIDDVKGYNRIKKEVKKYIN